MLLNIAFTAAWVQAEELEAVGNFIASAYSPEKDVYVAVARSIDQDQITGAASGSRTEIWFSDDFVNWEPVLQNKPGINSFNQWTKQVLVWWPGEEAFVADLGGEFYYSRDGREWKPAESIQAVANAAGNSGFKGSSTMATNGEYLAIVGNHKILVTDSLDNVPAETTTYVDNAGQYGSGIGISPDTPYVCTITNSWQRWRWNEGDTLAANVYDGGISPVWDLAYSVPLEGWVVAKGWNANGEYLPALKTPSAGSNAPEGGLQLSTGGTSTSGSAAVEVSDTDIFIGTKDGNILVTPNAEGALSAVWTPAVPGSGVELVDQPIGTITAVGEDEIFFSAGKDMYYAIREGDTFIYYPKDYVMADITPEDGRIVVPAFEPETVEIYPTKYTVTGVETNLGTIESCTVAGECPAGLTAEPVTEGIKLTVDSTFDISNEVKLNVVTSSGYEAEIPLLFVDEAELRVTGPDMLTFPREGEGPFTHEYIVEVLATDGQAIPGRQVNITVDQLPVGVTLEDGVFTVTSEAEPGEMTITFTSVARPELTVQKTVGMIELAPAKVEILTGEDEVYVENSGERTYEYTAQVLDYSGDVMPEETVAWSVTRNGAAVSGIEIDKNTGVLTVKAEAEVAPFQIIATCVSAEDVYAEKQIVCITTDERSVDLDLARVVEMLENITHDVVIPQDGLLGTEISWVSEDEDIVPDSGIIICPTRQDGGSTMVTITVKKNGVEKSQEVEVKLQKAETIGINCDVEEGTTEHWESANEMAVSGDAHNGQYAIAVTDSVSRVANNITNNSSYGFNVFVKAEAGATVQLYTEKGGQMIASAKAGEGYTEIKGSFDYRNQEDIFTDTISVRADGDFLVDDFKMYEITLEYNEASKAVADAEYSRKQADIDAAQKVLNDFYDLPIRDELQERLDKIVPKKDSTGGGGGGGGTGGSGSFTPPASSGVNPIYPAGENQSGNDYEDALDTALLIFKDMKGHWAKEDVEYMAALDLVSGKAEGTFAPDDTVTRAEFAVLITRAMGLSTEEYANSFFDVVSEDWYAGYVQAAKSAGYMNGSDGLFRPNDPISREEIATVIVAAYNAETNTQLEKGGALYFNDIDEIGPWAYDYIVEAVNEGFVAGLTEDTFAPKAEATRAQAVVMLRRVYDKLHGSAESAEGGNEAA